MSSVGMPVSEPGQQVRLGELEIICEPLADDDTTAASVWGAGFALARHILDGGHSTVLLCSLLPLPSLWSWLLSPLTAVVHAALPFSALAHTATQPRRAV